MASQYHIDLEQFTLDQFRQDLETGRLLPSEAVLAEKLAERFTVLSAIGIENLRDLAAGLSTKKKRERFAQESGLPIGFLTVLRRRVNSYEPRPIPLAKLPGIDPGHIGRLASVGIKDTMRLFDCAKDELDRAQLARQTEVPDDVLLELLKLSDVARAPYVGPAFARLLIESGVDTIARLAAQSPESLRERLVATKHETGVYRASIPGVEDMASWLNTVRRLPRAIEL